jgi:hypothetical protein
MTKAIQQGNEPEYYRAAARAARHFGGDEQGRLCSGPIVVDEGASELDPVRWTWSSVNRSGAVDAVVGEVDLVHPECC